jgi:hypothetical protein
MKKSLITYSIDKTREFAKSIVIWGEIRYERDFGLIGYRMEPLIYLQKPKWLSEESFEKIISGIELNLKEGLELRGKNDT